MKRKPSEIDEIEALWHELSGFPLWANGLKALENYLALLDFETVEEAVIISAERSGSRFDRWRYCCGILRNTLAERLTEEPKGQQVR